VEKCVSVTGIIGMRLAPERINYHGNVLLKYVEWMRGICLTIEWFNCLPVCRFEANSSFIVAQYIP